MTLAALKEKIAAAGGGTLALEAADFGIESVADLFGRYVPGGTLTISNCVPDAGDLSVTGSLSLGAASSASARVAILADESGQEATGIAVTLPLESWQVDLPFAKVNATEIGKRGGSNPRLELSAGGNVVSLAPASARIAGDFPLPITPPQAGVIAADVQPAALPPLNYQFDVQPANAEIDGFAALAALASGFSFTPPVDIPLGTTLQLVAVGYTIEPATGELAAICFDLLSQKNWSIIPGVVEIESFEFQLFLVAPAVPGPLVAAITATVGVHGETILLSSALPSLAFSGRLDHDAPIPLGPFLAKFGADDDFFAGLRLSAFEFSVGLTSPFPYSASLEIEEAPGAAQITLNGESIQLQTLIVDVDAEGSGTAEASFGGEIQIGEVPLYLTASKSSGGWQFAGGTDGNPPIDFAGWIDSVANTYKFEGLPSSIKALTISRINLLYDSGDADKTFTFDCAGELKVSDVTLNAAISVKLSETGGVPSTDLGGTLTIEAGARSIDFTLTVTVNSGGTTLIGTVTAEGDPVGLADILAALGFDADLPDGLNIKLQDLGVAYRTRTEASGEASTFILTAEASGYGRAMLVIDRTQAGSTYLFAIDAAVHGSLSDIPIIGGAIPAGHGLALDGVQLLVASKPVPADEMASLDVLVKAVDAALPPGSAFDLPAATMTGRACLAVTYVAGADPPHQLLVGAAAAPAAATPSALSAPPSPGATAPPTPAAPPPPPTPGADGTKWISLQRQIGPLHFDRIGFGYSGGKLTVAIDAGAALGPLSLTLDGLTIASPLTGFSPSFNLEGIGIGYSQAPLEIAGALLKAPASQSGPAVDFQFDGAVSVALENIGISGIASYAQITGGPPSMFAFAELLMPLGGPPPFFVTGLMAGFGFNRSLAIPAMDEVQSFPLLTLAQPPAQPAQTQTLSGVLTALETKPWIVAQPGAFWFAAGVQFTSFELVTTKALLVVDPTGDFTVALLGLSSMTLPQSSEGKPAYCFVELQLDAVFKPDDGSFCATALLSNNSYVLTPDCHLTGGFAFAAWFGSNQHAGDFVITLGGYHPAFTPPPHYPAVPRLAFNWAVSDNVTIQGDAYFALTPSVGMGGGSLQALFHDGDLHAWFTANADLLMSWRPFWFIGDIDVSIGISYRLNLLVCHKTVSLSVGASVTIWGPPTGGTVHVHLVVVSFTVSFGSDNAGSSNDPLGWGDFKALLPQPGSICTVAAGSSLAKTLASTDGRATNPQIWVALPRGFSFSTRSAMAASQLACDAPGAPNGAGAAGQTVSIRPMQRPKVTSTHMVKISKDDPAAAGIALDGWSFTASTRNLPASLWGPVPADMKQAPAAPSNDVVGDQLVGYDIATPSPTLNGATGAVPYSNLTEEWILPDGAAPLTTAIVADPAYLPAASDGAIGAIASIDTGTAAQGRASLFAALTGIGSGGFVDGPLSNLAARAEHLFADSPMEEAA